MFRLAMSPSVEEIRRAAELRMRELTPVLREIAQLQRILKVTEEGEAGAEEPGFAEAAGLTSDRSKNGNDNGDQKPEFAVANGVLRPRRGPDGRAVRGSNKSVILEVVRANPGIAAPEIAALTDLKREVISATIYRLKKQGAVVDYGNGVRIAVAPAKKRRFIRELAETKPGIGLSDLADVAGLDPAVATVTVDHMIDHDELASKDDGLFVGRA